MSCSESGPDQTGHSEPHKGNGTRWLKLLTYLIAAGALAYVLWKLDFSDLWHGLARMIWWPVILAVVLQAAPRIVQAWRWGYLLRPIKTQLSTLLHAIYVGTLMNGVLPLCPSDLVRGVLVARRTSTGTWRILSSQAIERAADGLALVLVALLAFMWFDMPAAVSNALWGVTGLVGVLTLAGLAAKLQHRRLHGYVVSRSPSGKVGKALKTGSLDFLSGTKAIKGWTMPFSISTGLLMVGLQVAVMWLMLYAYHLDLSLLESAALFAIITVGTLVPNAPGKIGAWQFFCIMGLGIFGVPAEHAAGFSLIAFAIWTVPSLLVGVVALILSPVSWAELAGRRRTRADAPAT